MIVQSERLGELEIPEDKIITMKRPILGFESLKRFCIIEVEDMAPFFWLQSLENEAVAFILVNPVIFWPEYRINIISREIAELCVERVESVETYVLVTFGSEPRDMSANLQGPVLINTENNLGKQLILVNSAYQVTHSIMDAVDAAEATSAVESEATHNRVKEELVSG